VYVTSTGLEILGLPSLSTAETLITNGWQRSTISTTELFFNWAAERDEHEAQLEYWIWYWTDDVPPAQKMWTNYNYFRNQA